MRTELRSRVQQPFIIWEDKKMKAIWELSLKQEIDSGFWANSRIQKFDYLIAKTFTNSSIQGTNITKSLTLFDFSNKFFLMEQGYYISLIMTLSQAFNLSIIDLNKLCRFAESFIAIDFKDDNSDYRRIQVSEFSLDERNIPDEYYSLLKENVEYFKRIGINMKEVVEILKNNPYTKKEITKVLVKMSNILKNKISLEELKSLSNK